MTQKLLVCHKTKLKNQQTNLFEMGKSSLILTQPEYIGWELEHKNFKSKNLKYYYN